jgi:integrase
MSDTRWLLKQGDSWSAVIEVPRPLQDQLGRRLKKSLATRDLAVAQQRRWKVIAELKATIEMARKGVSGQHSPLETEALEWRRRLSALTPEDEDGYRDYLEDLARDRLEILRDHHSDAQLRAFVAIAEGTAMPITVHLDDWLNEVPLKPRTVAYRRRVVSALVAWLQKQKTPTTVESVTRRLAGRYVVEGLAGHPTTAAKAVQTLVHYWSYLERRGFVAEGLPNVFTRQAPRRGSLERERAFSRPQIERLLSEAPEPLRSFVAFCAGAALRREECARLQVKDIADGWLTVTAGKTINAKRTIPVHSGLVGVVERLTEGRPPDAYLFPEMASKTAERGAVAGKRFGRLLRSLGMVEGDGRRSLVNLHSVRRYAAGELARSGVPMWTVKRLLGHADGLGTTSRYIDRADAEVMRQAVEAIWLPALYGPEQTGSAKRSNPAPDFGAIRHRRTL